MSSSPLFISLIPNLMQGEGHILPYHGAVKAAVESLGWEYLAWIPADEQAMDLKAEAVLSAVDLEAEGGLATKITRIPQGLQWGNGFARQLQGLARGEGGDRPIILFLERFIHLQLLGLWWGLKQMPPSQRQNIHLWILYRRDVHRDQTRPVYRWLQGQFFKLLPRQCQCLTDSDPLGRSLQGYFQTPFTVMPIPHTDFPELVPLPIKPDPIVCWWPGSPREEKGWSVVKNLAQGTWTETLVELVAANAAQLVGTTNGVKVRLIGDRLSREEYAAWLNRAQVILLPYDPVAYQERTSGIFTEAIIAGRIPVVSAGTWMAAELNRYDLAALVLDWQNPLSVWRSVGEIVNNAEIRQKLMLMRQAYCQFHCLENYTQVLQGLANPV